MNELEPGPAAFPGKVFENAIALLSYNLSDITADLASLDPKVAEKAQKTRDARIVLRDGLLFQHLSWVAAAIEFPTATTCPPHVRKADKGFDGVLIEVHPTALGLSRLVLCEDKASPSPRALVTGKIWPEIKLIVDGQKDLEILAVVTGLLDTMHGVDREAVLTATTWEGLRQYRIALTADPKQLKAGGYEHLFEGYDQHVVGKLQSRMAEIMPMPDVRTYLDALASQVVVRLQAMAAHV